MDATANGHDHGGQGRDGQAHWHGYALDTPNPGVLAELRRWLRTIVAGINPELLTDLELVATELATNALEHAAGPRRLRLIHHRDPNSHADVVRVEVEDASPDLLPTPGRSRLDQHRGRGLQLINALARWGLRRDHTNKTIWAELSTPPEAAAT